MSAALKRSLAANGLKVRKVASGEAVIVFRNPVAKTDEDGNKFSVTISPVRIAHGNSVDLFARKDVDKDAVSQSNLNNLLKMGAIEVV
jgi:hypothetical protein